MTHATKLAELRAIIAAEFETLGDAALEECGRHYVLEEGGTILPVLGDGWGPHEVEVSLLEVKGNGDTLAAALRTWCKRAARMQLRMEQDAAEGLAA